VHPGGLFLKEALPVHVEGVILPFQRRHPAFTNQPWRVFSTTAVYDNYGGTGTVEEGAREVMRLALLGPDGPTGTIDNVFLSKAIQRE